MNIFKRIACLLNLIKCDVALVEIFPMDLTKAQTKRLLRCSKCKRVRYKINVRG